ncbi:MAG: sodium-dependent transporter [Spirochaetaceae bacterium]|nr:sodium-dependent transporter [Spirochaetaceae bacterium]
MASKQTKTRDGFASSVGAFAATLGSAVGLGNIWKFPYLTGSNGGAAFVIAYLLSVLLVGLPILVAEHLIGRKTRLNAIHAYGSVVKGKKYWSLIGWAGFIAAILIMAYYTDVAGWVFAYVFKAIGAAISGTTLNSDTFNALAGGTWEPLAWQFVVLVITSSIIAAGVSRGIERVTKTLMPVLVVLLILCDIRALTLPGAFAGVEYLFKPDFSKLTGNVMLTALGLSFFKLSLGMGTMTTYGSYMPDETRIVPNAAKVALSDTIVSILAGLAIFPAVFAFGGSPAGGPGLLFNVIPLIFSKMPLGSIFTVIFFILSSIATIGAMVSLIEVPVSWMVEKGRMKRPAAAYLTGAMMFGLGILATLSQGPALGNAKIFGKNFFDLFDYVSSNVLLPLGGLAIAILTGWLLKKGEVVEELSKGYGTIKPRYIQLIYIFIKYVSPVLIFIIILNGFGVIK